MKTSTIVLYVGVLVWGKSPTDSVLQAKAKRRQAKVVVWTMEKDAGLMIQITQMRSVTFAVDFCPKSVHIDRNFPPCTFGSVDWSFFLSFSFLSLPLPLTFFWSCFLNLNPFHMDEVHCLLQILAAAAQLLSLFSSACSHVLHWRALWAGWCWRMCSGVWVRLGFDWSGALLCVPFTVKLAEAPVALVLLFEAEVLAPLLSGNCL